MISDVNILQLLFSELEPGRQLHCLECAKVAVKLIAKNEKLRPYKDELLFLAQYHDIGYSNHIANTGFHPLDGALFLRSLKVSKSIVTAVALHSDSISLATDDSIKNVLKENFGISVTSSVLLECIDLIDSHVSKRGDIVTLAERTSVMLDTYGKSSIQYITIHKNKNLLENLEKKYSFNSII